MKSITKSLLANDVIEMLVRKNFDHAAAVSEIRELGGGMFNAVYSLRVQYSDERKSDELVLKVSPFSGTKVTTIEKAIMRTEVFMYGLLPGKGIPVPAVAAYDFSREHIDCDYFFMTKLSGTSWNKAKLSKSDKTRLKADFAKHLAHIHEIKGNQFGDIKEKSSLQFDTWQEAIRCNMDNIIGDAKRDGHKFPYKKIYEALAPHWHLLDEIRTPTLVYCDLWAGNIFLTNESGRHEIQGFIDPERSFWGDPLSDLISSFGIYSDIRKEPELQKAYAEASGKPFEITKNDEIRMSIYKMHDALFMGVETYRYNKIYGFFQLIYSKYLVRKQIKELNAY